MQSADLNRHVPSVVLGSEVDLRAWTRIWRETALNVVRSRDAGASRLAARSQLRNENSLQQGVPRCEIATECSARVSIKGDFGVTADQFRIADSDRVKGRW